MALEYQTVKFANDRNGIAEKNVVTDRMARQGWAVSSEAIEQGHFKGDEACCGAMICLPCGLLAGEHRATLWSRTVEKIVACNNMFSAKAAVLSRPGWETYASLLEFADVVRRDLREMRPRDLIDIQSFIWVLGSNEY